MKTLHAASNGREIIDGVLSQIEVKPLREQGCSRYYLGEMRLATKDHVDRYAEEGITMNAYDELCSGMKKSDQKRGPVCVGQRVRRRSGFGEVPVRL